MVSAPLINWPSTDPTQHPFHTFTKPGPICLTERHHVLDCLTTSPSVSPSASLSCFPTKNTSDSPRRGSFQHFQPKFLPDPPARVQSKNSNQPPPHIYQRGSIRNFHSKILLHQPDRVNSKISQEKSMFRPKITPNYHPSKIP